MKDLKSIGLFVVLQNGINYSYVLWSAADLFTHIELECCLLKLID